MRSTTPAYYRRLWDTLKIQQPAVVVMVADAVQMLPLRSRYDAVHLSTGVPWWLVGCLHMRESDFRLNCCLHNGQTLSRVTTLVPKGRGPFPCWEASAVDALEIKRKLWPAEWTIEAALAFAEHYNGLGYARRGVNSPYLWAGSQHGRGTGKYIADGRYDPKAHDRQTGVATLLKFLERQGYVTVRRAT